MGLTLAGLAGPGKPLPVFASKAGGLAVYMDTITFDSSYPTGGETLDLRPYFSTLYGVMFAPLAARYKIVYDYTNRKVLVYDEDQTSGVHAQVANTTDLSAIGSAAFIAFGVAALDQK